MKRILIGTALALIFAGPAMAEMETDAGSQQLIFTFSGLSNLGASSYDSGITPSIDIPSGGSQSAGGVGLRHFLSDGTAVRAGVDLAFLTGSVEPDGGNKTDVSGFALGLNAALEKYRNPPSARVNPYIGVIGGFGLSNGKNEVTVKNGDNREDTISAFGFGAAGILGFVAEIFDGVQLGAEYRAGLSLESGSLESTVGSNTSKADTSSFDFGISSLSFLLSVALN